MRTAQTQSVGLELDMPLDAEIADTVHLLRREGIETIESCQGGEGHVFPEPTVRFCGGRGEGFRAYSVCIKYGLPVYSIRRVWGVDDEELTGPWWEIVFYTKPRRE